MTLILKYDRKGIISGHFYTEETTNYATKQDFLTAMRFLKKHHDTVIQIDNTVCGWNSISDFEHETLTVFQYESTNSRKEYIQDFTCFKKEWSKKFQ